MTESSEARHLLQPGENPIWYREGIKGDYEGALPEHGVAFFAGVHPNDANVDECGFTPELTIVALYDFDCGAGFIRLKKADAIELAHALLAAFGD